MASNSRQQRELTLKDRLSRLTYLQACKLLGGFTGKLVSDRYNAYNCYQYIRQICWAHLKRVFKAISETDGRLGKIGLELHELANKLLNMRIFQISIIWGLGMIILVFSGGCCSCHQIGQKVTIKDDIEGRWVGKWHCEQTGDSGKIRCHLMELEEGLYQARFDGTYWGFFPFWITIQMAITERDGVYYTQAEEDLGWLGGGIEMLVVSQKLFEKIKIGDDITISVVDIRQGSVRLGITAPKCMPINRIGVPEGDSQGQDEIESP